MKKADIAMIILIVSISALVAYFVAKAVIGSPKQSDVTVKTAEPISSQVDDPGSSIFNHDAINPTVERRTGQSADSLPF